MNGRTIIGALFAATLLAFLAARSCERVAVHGIDAVATRVSTAGPDRVSQVIDESLRALPPAGGSGDANWVAWFLLLALVLFSLAQLAHRSSELIRQLRLWRRRGRRRPAARRDLSPVPRVPRLRPVDDEYYG